jgi:transposase-like protein
MIRPDSTTELEQPGVFPVVSTEIAVKPTRRKFTVEYKLKILQETDQCKPGDVGAVLRREGLFSSNLAAWRREREVGQLQSLAPRRRGRKPHPLEAENALLKKQLARTERKLEEAEIILDAQKKLCQLFGMNPLPEVEGYLSSQSSKKPPEG